MARLFILSRAYAADLDASAQAPGPGDVVALFRQAQDPEGSTAGRWRQNGVTVVMAEFLVSLAEGRAIEAAIRPACYSWYVVKGEDLSRWEGLSIGEMLAPYIWINYNILYLVRSGIIIKRLLAAFPAARDVVTDMLDDVYFYTDNRQTPGSLPWRRLLETLVVQDGRSCLDLPSSLPSVVSSFRPIACSASLRPTKSGLARALDRLHPQRLLNWGLLNWGRLTFGRNSKPLVYLFIQGAVERVARALADRGTVRVVANCGCGLRVAVVPFQDIPPEPEAALHAVGQRLQTLVDTLARDGVDHPAFKWDGIDFGPWVGAALGHLVAERLDDVLRQTAQLFQVMNRLRPQAVVLSAAYGVANTVVAGLGRRLGYRHYFVNHGHDFVYCTIYNSAAADPEMVYLSEGDDHLEGYGYFLPDDKKPRRITVANPAAAVSADLKKQRSETRLNTILVLNYSCCTPHTIVRSGYFDQYLIDVINVGIKLDRRGFRMIYRGHPAENKDYARDLIRTMNADKFMTIDESPSFERAILKCDVVVCNITTCYYIALAAGWPTIFHEPGYDRQDFVGLPAAEDTGRPLSTTPEALLDYIVAAYDPDSAVARFPARFAGPLASRFFNATSRPPDQAIADFLCRELRV